LFVEIPERFWNAFKSEREGNYQMKPQLKATSYWTKVGFARIWSGKSRPQRFGISALLACSCALAAFCVAEIPRSAASARAAQAKPQAESSSAVKTHSNVDLSNMNQDELAHYVFEHHGCKTCHTLGKDEKLGFTDKGKEAGKNFQGCISLLTSMNVIAQVKPANRTPDEKRKAAQFKEFGCTECHQITPGKLGLTEYGKKLKSLHMACTDVERILASNGQAMKERSSPAPR
jgi:cytochrome c2